MSKISKPLLAMLKKESHARAPFWFMRQAGRYLPEYRELRGKAKHFLDFCYTPSMASEATLQPIRRFGMDGAIIFSDILVIPDALGMKVWFEEGKGPLLMPVQTRSELGALTPQPDKLLPVYEALKLTKAALPDETTLIGFCGAPWTLACYMIEGKGSRDFQKVRSLGVKDPAFFSRLLEMLVDAVSSHAIAQIKAGAEVIQIFDSWSGVLSEQQFASWVIAPTKRIVSRIKKACPDVPVIGFPRQAGTKFLQYALETGVDAVSVDASVDLQWVAKNLMPICVVQGNLDPIVLADDKAAMLAQAEEIVSAWGKKSFANPHFVFNLGHGILPHTPPDNMLALCQFLRNRDFG